MHSTPTRLVGALCFLLTCGPAVRALAAEPASGVSADVENPEIALRRTLGATAGLKRDDPRWRENLLAMYGRRAWQPLWSGPTGVTKAAQYLLVLLQEAANYGLDPRDYRASELSAQGLAQASSLSSAAARRTFDAALSTAAARFISDLHSGRVDPRRLGHDLDVPHASLDVGSAVAAVAGSSDVAGVIADFEPGFKHYDLLKAALSKYRALALDATLTQLPRLAVRSVKPGESYAGAAALRRLLRAVGDMPESTDTPSTAEAALLDPALAEGLKSFQKRHGLKPDGTLGVSSFNALTVPLSTRVRQIELSLERLRWLPPQLNSLPLLVNIPQFKLFGFYTKADEESQFLQMNVIVGKTFPRNNTPVFAADMRFVVIRPYWDVPANILRDEFIDKIRANPAWLTRNHFEIVDGQGDDGYVLEPTTENIEALARGALRLRQLPGDTNSLGVAKLMFPNTHNVYLHGTPAQGLFAEARRAFSHGCVRVEDPLALAAFVLRDQPQWSRENLEAAAQLTRPTRIALTQPRRVFIIYATAIATESGRTLFFEDIYGHDRRLNAQLAR